jgi:hypothetical protein
MSYALFINSSKVTVGQLCEYYSVSGRLDYFINFINWSVQSICSLLEDLSCMDHLYKALSLAQAEALGMAL